MCRSQEDRGVHKDDPFLRNCLPEFCQYECCFQGRTKMQVLMDIFSLQQVPDQDGANLDSPDLDVLLLNTVMDNIRSMSAGVQKTMLKSIITSLLDHSKPLYRYSILQYVYSVLMIYHWTFLGRTMCELYLSYFRTQCSPPNPHTLCLPMFCRM